MIKSLSELIRISHYLPSYRLVWRANYLQSVCLTKSRVTAHYLQSVLLTQLRWKDNKSWQLQQANIININTKYSQMCVCNNFFPVAQQSPSEPGLLHYRDHTITLRHTTIYRTPLEEWSAWRRDLYLKAHNTYRRYIRASGGIRTSTSSKRAASDPHLWPRALGLAYS